MQTLIGDKKDWNNQNWQAKSKEWMLLEKLKCIKSLLVFWTMSMNFRRKSQELSDSLLASFSWRTMEP